MNEQRLVDFSLIADVVKFEIARSLTPGRISIWAVIAGFPIVMAVMIRFVIGNVDPDVDSQMLYWLISQIACLLGLLLWSTPVVSTELEGQTWIYLAMRQSGRSMVLVGKYITAVVWTFAAALVSATVCCVLLSDSAGLEIWFALCVLSLLSCCVYSAIFVLIGIFFFRRTMVAAVIYTLIVEFGLGNVPAVINQATVSYRLRSLMADWSGNDSIRSAGELLYGSDSPGVHVLVLLTMAAACLVVSLYRLRYAEYPTQQDGSA